MNQSSYNEESSKTQEMEEEHFHPHLSLLLINNDTVMESVFPVAAPSILLWKTDLSKRAINVCKLHDWTGRSNVKDGNLKMEEFKPLATIGDLCNWTKKELLELQNCGNKTITDFEVLLGKYGLKLRD